MVRVKVVLQPRAQQDLEDIWLYTYKKWGLEQAGSYAGALNDQFKGLARNPNLGRKCGYICDGYRRLEVQKHVVFYRVKKGEVNIVRILHQSMDVDEHI